MLQRIDGTQVPAGRIARTALAALLGVVLSAAAHAKSPQPPGSIDAWPAGPRGTLIRPEVEATVDKLLASLTLEEKIGQMIQADIESITPAELAEYRLGSVLLGGNGAPGGDVRSKPAAWVALADTYARAALSRSSPAHAPIPLLLGIDAMHGHAHIPGATVFPHNVGLGAAHDPDLITRIGRATSAEVAATGFDWSFAPTVAVVRDVRWGRAYESYSEDPKLVAAYSAAMVAGLQGAIGSPEFMGPGRTVSSVKHFMGDGGTLMGRDQYDNRSSTGEFIRVHSAGYPPAIAAGVLTVMASYSSWNGVKMHANHFLLTDVLKERFGFNGFVVGDWNAQEEVPGCSKSDCPAAVRAGLDMFMAPDGWKELYKNTLRHARSGELSTARIDDAVRRILRVKVLAGVFEHPLPTDRPTTGHFEELGRPEHRAIAREAVRKSLVLLKNDGNLLPLSPHGHLLVAGGGADDIGQQSGGWTIDWQGAHNTNADFPGGTSIFAGLKAAMEAGGGTAELSRDGRFTETPAAAVVVFGEHPYAEYFGDRENLAYSADTRHDLMLMRNLRARGIPVVAVFLTGRPMWVNPEINAANAFVAAWLPGSEGGGVADVLIRGPDDRVHFDFTGRLSFSWPATPMPVVLDEADHGRGALFARGFGLDYAHPAAATPALAELSAPANDRQDADFLFASGRVYAPWSLYVSDATAGVRLTTREQATPGGTVGAALADGNVRATWNGSGDAMLTIGGRSTDLSGLAEHGGALRLRLRVDAAPTGAVRLGIRCGAPFGAEVPADGSRTRLSATVWSHCRGPVEPTFDVTSELTAKPVGEWTVLSVPLSCFAGKGADLTAVGTPFVVSSGARMRLTIADVRITHAGTQTACPLN